MSLSTARIGVLSAAEPKLEPRLEPKLAWRQQAGIAALLFCAVLLTHLPSFFRSVMDWDESLYFLMAEQWRQGHLPYTAIWDNKPIGIYGIFALFQSGLGDNVISIRIATVLFITAAAIALFNMVLNLRLGQRRTRLLCAWAAALAYVIGSLTNDGLSANTEIFMACFTSLAVLAALRGSTFLAGLSFGLAFMTKYVVLFEFPALAFALLAIAPPSSIKAAIRPALLLLLGAALPLLATAALYAASGHLHAWAEDSILSNFRRVSVPISAQAVAYVTQVELIRWTPLYLVSLTMLAMAAWRLPRILASEAARFNLFLALWLLGGCLGVASSKSFFDHYFLQLLPVMCLTLAWLLLTLAPALAALPGFVRLLIFAALAAQPLAAGAAAMRAAAGPNLTLANGRIAFQRDTPTLIAREIQPLLTASDHIYVFDYQPIIYSLAGLTPPTKYAFPSVLTKCQLASVANVHAVREVNRILATRPEFIIRSLTPFTDPKLVNLHVYATMDRVLAARYELWRLYDEAAVYRLANPTAPVDPELNTLPPACPK